MEAVNKDDYWRDSSPSELLFYYKKLITLIKAAHQIYKKNKAGKTAIDLLKAKRLHVETNLLHPALYFGWGRNETMWDHFPRYLTMEEYIDPYLVFPQFFSFYSLKEWHKELSELLSDGLSNCNPDEFSGQDRDMLLIEKNLLKLVEAVHLIDVREVGYIGDFKKKYPFTLNVPCEKLEISRVLSVPLKKENKSKASEEIISEDDEDGDEEDEYEDEEDEYDDEEDEENEEEEDEDEYDDEEDDNDDNEAIPGKGKSNDDILTKSLMGDAKNIRIIIRGNYVVNHPAKKD
jgi:hypothetical protein